MSLEEQRPYFRAWAAENADYFKTLRMYRASARGAPRPPPGPVELFVRAIREKFPQLKRSESRRLAERRWQEMGHEDRAHFMELAGALQDEYLVRVRAYEARRAAKQRLGEYGAVLDVSSGHWH
mmetsp:Transcript_26443/g.74240  ORF Transcript_26443/g.74240 Transcript_26443/m.74240 type:complete len:124 (-) Transcript_26443:80-451(-)